MLELVILDRDGVLNQDRPDYVKNLDELIMLEGAAQAIAKLNKANIPVAIATNQACIDKGIITEAQLTEIHGAIDTHLAQYNAHIDLWLHCPDNTLTHRRKPAPGMLEEALMHFDVAAKHAIFVGDALRDLQAAQAANCQPILVKTGKGAKTALALPPELSNVTVCENLKSVVDLYLNNLS